MKRRIRKKLGRGEFAPRPPLTAYQRIRAELRRQRVGEGYSEAHDDAHQGGALERAADAYALPLGARGHLADADFLPAMWPWEAQYWKPTAHDRERELVKAGALYEAEIERLDRLEAHYQGLHEALDPSVLLSAYQVLASKATRGYERLKAKQALLETQLNQALLRSWLPTQLGGPRAADGLSPQALIFQRLACLRRPGQQKGTPWFVKWQALSEGRMELVVAIWEYPHGYDFDARWQFDSEGRITSYVATQAGPRFEAGLARLVENGPSAPYLRP